MALTPNLQHGVNMNTSLTTFDGYPRADIDVAQIRTTRARIVRLKTDYKVLMAELEKAVEEQFAQGKAAGASTTAASRASVVQPEVNEAATASGASSSSAIEPPFAKVNTVVPNSPADQAGLRVGDKITKFGSVNWTNHERLGRVAQVVQQNENVSMLIISGSKRDEADGRYSV